MDWYLFLIYLIICFSAASTGALFPTGKWYKELAKPKFNPPDWAFPIAWSLLYPLMAYAATQMSSNSDREYPMAFWTLQIVFNTLWTPVFFGLNRIRTGMIIMSCLWISVTLTVGSFYWADPFLGLILVPYFLWVTFAAILNYALLKLNPVESH